jgi:hypothetical protein
MNTFTLFWLETDHGIQPVSVVLLFLPLIFRIVWDGYKILVEREEINHEKHTTATACFMFLTSYAVFRIEPVRYMVQPVLLSWGIFWLFFDYLLNLLRGKNFFYVDQGEVSAKIEKVYVFLGPWKTLAVKLWWFTVVLSVYFHMSYILGERPAY